MAYNDILAWRYVSYDFIMIYKYRYNGWLTLKIKKARKNNDILIVKNNEMSEILIFQKYAGNTSIEVFKLNGKYF